jgi:hypothetical protein
MSASAIHPPGEKIKNALLEFSELLEEKGEQERKSILQKIVLKYDLSPRESDFLRRQCLDERN